MAVLKIQADELIPGDLFNTNCGIADLGAFARVITKRMIENDAPGSVDRVEIRYESDCISPTRVLLANSTVEIWQN